MQLAALHALSCLIIPWACSGVPRPATTSEIQALFDLATVAPQRLRVVADIITYEPAWSGEDVVREMEQQNKLYKDLAQSQSQQERSNAIARSHSGKRIQHVQEWYSGNHYRLDQTDEGMVSEQYLKKRPAGYKNTFVNINDPALSPYRSFFADHDLLDAQLSKTTLYSKNDLWRALGLEGEVAFPLLVALVDSRSARPGRPFTDVDSSMLKMDSEKAERLRSGSNSTWQLEAISEAGAEERTRFLLRGKFPSPDTPPDAPGRVSALEYVYVLGRSDDRVVCIQASYTNHTAHTSLVSQREPPYKNGFPRVWKRTTFKPGVPPAQVDVEFKMVELNPAAKDEQIFSAVFPSNYIVSDVTSGQAVLLQQPVRASTASQPLRPQSSSRRVLVLCLLGSGVIGLGVALLRLKGR